MARVILIDADVYAYKASAAIEEAIHWGDGYWTWHCDANAVKTRVLEMIEETMENLKGTEVRLCLTDSAFNWRHSVLPTYKGNRAATKRPLVLRHIKEWLIEEHDAIVRPGLEGDDLLGIFSTWSAIKGDKLIVSLDKDMKTIPGLYVRDALPKGNKKPEIIDISEAEAAKWHLKQTLSGDATDGYAGCPGIGVDTAAKIIDKGLGREAYEHVLKRGPRKGEVEVRYKDVPMDNLWDVVVSYYEAAGLTEEDALVQARVARILHRKDYDMTRKEPILWTPDM
jgi:DNA polymerase-1